MKNLLHETAKNEILGRINKLTPQTSAVWGKMNVNQNFDMRFVRKYSV